LVDQLSGSGQPGYSTSVERAKPKLGEFLPVIDEILEADKTAPPKQRHTARRIFERLRDEYGYTGGITQVRDAVAQAKRYRLQDAKARTNRAAKSVTETMDAAQTSS
jgi:transposase